MKKVDLSRTRGVGIRAKNRVFECFFYAVFFGSFWEPFGAGLASILIIWGWIRDDF